ncbi:unnamed protein product [Blepharisma stoltei]|uniref:Peptidase S11 D-alanyl-D-alanine carboxypeptidase A N-terminal domain-containing protein n=1 Tax=Blepharisma stoltei TaxID=1481888 RepID=A0AAU9J153_9CILI|nr:unnamed protein product [Blepharisma stoltei]
MQTPKTPNKIASLLPPRCRPRNIVQAILSTKKPLLPHPHHLPSKTSLNSSSTQSSLSLSSSRDTSLKHRSQSETKRNIRNLAAIPYISASSWCILEGNSGNLIYGHFEGQIREIASLTKIMTCYVAIKLIKESQTLNLNTIVKVSTNAQSAIGTSAELKAGDELTMKDLLHGLMLPSGNDAAWAIAEFLGHYLSPASIKPTTHFVAEMNRTARELGLDNTLYGNPSGLVYKKNTSTAKEVGYLASVALKEEIFRQIVSCKTYITNIRQGNGEIRKVMWENTNKLLGKGFEGVKTGVTNKAGPCLCASYRNRSHVIIVLLNSQSMESRWSEVKTLAEWGCE